MKQNIHIWFALLLFGLLIIGLVDKAHASTPPGTYRAYHYQYGASSFAGYSSASAAVQAAADTQCRNHDSNSIEMTELVQPSPMPETEHLHSRWRINCLREGLSPATYNWKAFYNPPTDCEELSHEGGRPEGAGCGTCATGYIPTPGAYAPRSESPVATGYECMRNREPEECKFLGKYEVQTNQGAFCVEQCAGIGDGGYCIDEAEKDPDEPQCSPDHPDFKGVAGYGGEAVLICGDPQNNCKALGDGYTWGVVEKNGTTVESCFPNAYNPPQCSGTDVLKKDQWGGFACLPLRKPGDNTEPGGENDPNNGDSDGDGQGDITGITGQLQDIKKLLGRGNTNTDNLNETLKGLGNQIKDGTKAITDAIGNIPGGGGGGTGDGGDGDGEQETPINWSGDPIDLKIGDGLEELNAIQGEYENLIANIRSEMAASFGSFTGGGGLEDNNVTLYGETFNAGLSKFGAHLSIVGSIILFAAAFIGLGIVMGAKD